jgi:hypothetical protein
MGGSGTIVMMRLFDRPERLIKFETAEIDIPLVCVLMSRAKYRLEQKLNRSGRVSTK